MILVNGKLTATVPAKISFSGMTPAWVLSATAHQANQTQKTTCSSRDYYDGLYTNLQSFIFCPIDLGKQPACGDTVSLDVDYTWGTMVCYINGGSRSGTATASASVECLTCPTTPPTNGADERDLPVGTECDFSASKISCQVVWQSTRAPYPVWKCQ
jgi:hypothetical protein